MNLSNEQKKTYLIMCGIISIFCGYWFLKIGMLCSGSNWIVQLPKALGQSFNSILTEPFKVEFTNISMLFALAGLAIPWLIFLTNISKRKPTRVGEEQGSSRWATLKEIIQFKNNREADTNLVFSKNTGLAVKQDKKRSLEDRLAYQRNCNVAVIGGSGSGKTRFYVKPNLMQCHGNYFVTDPKGTCIEEVGHLMEKEGYEVKMFNVIPAVKEQDENGNPIPLIERKSELDKSLTYNPLAYVKTKEQIPAFVNCLIKNTNGDKKGEGDPFWEKSETLLYIALLSFMQDWLPPEQFTLPKLCEILRLAQASETDENLESPLDLLFQEVETGYCYVSCDRNDTDDVIGGFQNILAEAYCVTTGQVKSQEQIKHVDGKEQVVTTFINTGISDSTNESGNKYSDEQKITVPLRGCGELNYKKGYIDVPSTLTNNIDGYSAWNEWYEQAHDNNEKDYKWDKNNFKYREDFCVLKYQEFKKAAGETLKSIIISCNVRLTPIAIPAISRILSGKLDEDGNPTGECEMELDKMGDPNRKICTFAIMSDTDDTYFFLVALMMYQAMDSLCNKALTDYGGSLPRFVHFVLDEFANLGVLPNFNRTIAITRSRNIGVSMILQTTFQLETNYNKETAKVIMDNCDTTVYLGGGSDGANESTCKEISAKLGKETITTQTANRTFGSMPGTSESNQIQARELMMPDEVSRLPRDEELVIIKNTYPFKDKKYVLEDNPRYAYIDPLSHNPSFPCKVHKNFNFERYYQEQRNQNITMDGNINSNEITSQDIWTNEQFEKLSKMNSLGKIDDNELKIAQAFVLSGQKEALDEFINSIEEDFDKAA